MRAGRAGRLPWGVVQQASEVAVRWIDELLGTPFELDGDGRGASRVVDPAQSGVDLGAGTRVPSSRSRPAPRRYRNTGVLPGVRTGSAMPRRRSP